MDFKIDKMSLEDLISIKDILTTEFDDFWNYEILKSELESNNSYFFVADITVKSEDETPTDDLFCKQ